MKYTQVACNTSQTFTFVMLLQNNCFMDMFGDFCYKITHIGIRFLPLGFNTTNSSINSAISARKVVEEEAEYFLSSLSQRKTWASIAERCWYFSFHPGCYVSPVAYEVRHAPLVYWVRKKQL